MKMIALALLTASLAACGSNQTTSATKTFVQPRPAVDGVVVQAAKLEFSRDLRPVDGDLKVLTLTKTAEGRYDATLRTAFYDRLNGHPVDKTESLGNGLQCVQLAANYDCKRDLRPVDGDLVELKLTRNADGAFDATLRRAYYDRINGKSVDQTKEIAYGLKRK
jgi:hypothetical protein